MPHAHPQLFAEGRARGPLHQLAAGSAGQLPRAPGFSRSRRNVLRRGRPRGGDGGVQPVRFLPRAQPPRNFPFTYEPKLAVELAPYLRKDPLTPKFETFLRSLDLHAEAHDRFSRRAQPPRPPGRPLHHPPGAGRADAGGNAHERQRLLPRLRLAAGAGPPPPRPRRALRLRLSDPASRRREGARRPVGRRAGLHRSARVVRSLPSRRGLDRARSDLGLFAGEGHIPLACSPEPSSAAPITGHRRTQRVDVRLRDEGHAHLRDAARHASLHRRNLGADRRARRKNRRHAQGAATCASPWAASRPSFRSTTWTARSGTPPRSARRNANSAAQLFKRMRTHFGPGGFIHYGQGKWYPGEPLPALGAHVRLAQRRKTALEKSRAPRRSAHESNAHGRR